MTKRSAALPSSPVEHGRGAAQPQPGVAAGMLGPVGHWRDSRHAKSITAGLMGRASNFYLLTRCFYLQRDAASREEQRAESREEQRAERSREQRAERSREQRAERSRAQREGRSKEQRGAEIFAHPRHLQFV